jgi:hypothetical protein
MKIADVLLYRGEGDSAEPVVYGLIAGKSYWPGVGFQHRRRRYAGGLLR